MKKKLLLTLLPVMAVALTSCGTTYKYLEHLDDYVYSMQYRDGFNILQLTDIHWNYNTSTKSSKHYLDLVLEEANRHTSGKIDLVEITGDLFMLYNSFHVSQFIDYFEEKATEYNFKYAVIWGNHDHHGLMNPNSLSKKFANASHCIHIDPNDDLYGRGNFVINLTTDGSKSGATKWQIANIDSGASFSETALSPFRDYDYIREDQTDWWLKEHNKVGDTVPTIAYYHIPQDENEQAWQDVLGGATYRNKFFRLEGFADNGTGNHNSNFVDEGKNHNLKACFMGHAHNVDWTVEYMGVTIGLGVKTGPELYFAHIDTESTDPAMQSGLTSVGINENFDLIGASLVSLTNDTGAFTLEHLYLNERVNGNFIKWVQW